MTTVIVHERQIINVIIPIADIADTGIFDETFDETFE